MAGSSEDDGRSHTSSGTTPLAHSRLVRGGDSGHEPIFALHSATVGRIEKPLVPWLLPAMWGTRRRRSDVRRNRSIPPSTVIPVLVYPDVREAVAWLSSAFGFVERTRIGDSHRAQVSIGADGAMIVADVGGERQPPGPGAVTHVIKVRVDDVDARYERALARGAQVLQPPIDREYGERECTLEDLAGHQWEFAETIRDVAPEEYGCETISPWPE